MSCRMCNNANIDPELKHDNDLSYISIGVSEKRYRIMMRSGANQPTAIIYERWNAIMPNPEWELVGVYEPNFCPHCGRKLIENKEREEG